MAKVTALESENERLREEVNKFQQQAFATIEQCNQATDQCNASLAECDRVSRRYLALLEQVHLGQSATGSFPSVPVPVPANSAAGASTSASAPSPPVPAIHDRT